ncbi:hypothetical protein HQ47_10260 [Porphyromonas macacae]|uniref:Glycosyltransferase 2-like domain-containing protein n=1 Tax=Porphyromonas macacae TaxID=28115 RepID=A0A0A2E3Y6_9PORP|nr:glycosyltransferase family 2 protein [Porphyromonas macacae]KGN72317.1 hypothetical protein HQ47_10260 [Porphyromonas macacae]
MYSEPKIEVLISSMFVSNVEDTTKYCSGASLLINQTDYTKFPNINIQSGIHRVISNEERGLSKSRNLALKNAIGDICLIADDDVIYEPDYEQKVQRAYSVLKDADVIIFDIIKKDKRSTIYKKKRKLGFLAVLKCSSIRISFKRNSIIDNGITFNELFGAGTDLFSSGEENIFLYECLKKKLKIYYFPEVILTMNSVSSTWFKGYTRKYFNTKGAFAYEIWGAAWFLYVLQFLIRHYIQYRKELSIFKALKYCKEGRQIYGYIREK